MATPFPLAYFTPTTNGPECNMYLKKDEQTTKPVQNGAGKKICSNCGKRKASQLQRKQRQQRGGAATGAPFSIPNFGRTKNLSGEYIPQAPTGFSYQFDTNNGRTPGCSMYGNNLPSFHPVIN